MPDSGFNLSLIQRCEKNGIPWWQCPSFVFVVMGAGNLAAMIISYQLSRDLVRIDVIALVVSTVAIILLSLSYIVSNSFERLLEVNEMKNEFINIVSHQLRAPLTSVKWATDYLIKSGLNGDSQESQNTLATLKDSNERMIKLLNELIIVARIQQGSLRMQQQVFSLNEIVVKIIQESEYYARANNVELVGDLCRENLEVYADPHYIRQALVNIIDNAIRYTQGKGKVVIKTGAQGETALCAIEDGGVGISKSEQKRVFRKFFRSENILRYQTEGAGLGLYTARAIIQMSGGTIYFQSKENEGTKFFINIPLKK